MSRFTTLFVFTAGGTATYLWMKENGGLSQVASRIDGLANKVRTAIGAGSSTRHMGDEVHDNATYATNDIVD